MADFINYTVNLTLLDGTISLGSITHVDGNQITLENVYQSSNPNFKVPSLNISSTQISDLKVVQLPQTVLESLKNKHLKFQNNQNKTPKPLLDDAIIFSLGTSKTVSKSNGNDSFMETPKTGASRESPVSTTWSTDGDVQDIKSSDFDFAANLAMFDKRSVFADFQKKDSKGSSDRLVGHNKAVKNKLSIPKAKKEKYDNDENVLESNRVDNWDNIGQGSTSKRNTTIKLNAGLISDTKKGFPGVSKTVRFLRSDTIVPVPMCSPVQLLEIERLASEGYGITPGIMAETCASHLSQLCIKNILGGASRLSNAKNHNLPPLVLLLIGNGRCGSRALATGRHLTNHGIRVLAFAINNEEQDLELSHQWKLFENLGGKSIVGDLNALMDILQNQLETPVELIIDALQGYDSHLEDIFYEEEDRIILQRLILWCNENKQRNKILSLDMPSGVDGGSGTISDEQFTITCRWCISMGLPIVGLIHAYKNGILHENTLHYMVDVGIPNRVYSVKSNLRKFDKVWYTSEPNVRLDVYDE